MFSDDEILDAMRGKYVDLVCSVYESGINSTSGRTNIVRGATARIGDVIDVDGVPVTIMKSRMVSVNASDEYTRADVVNRIGDAMQVLLKEVNADTVGRGRMAVVTRLPQYPDEHRPDAFSTVVCRATGCVFGVAKYLSAKQTRYEVSLAWGVTPLDPSQRVAA